MKNPKTPLTSTSLYSAYTPTHSAQQALSNLTSPYNPLSPVIERGNVKRFWPHTSEKPRSEHTSSYMTAVETAEQRPRNIKVRQKFKQTTNISAVIQILMPMEGDILEIYNDYEKNYKALGELDKIESAPPMRVQEQELKISEITKNQQYESLKLSDLHTNSQNKIKLQRFKFYYFRIRIEGRESPVQIFFSCPPQVQTSNYKLFLSTKSQFPTKFNAQYVIQSKFAKIYCKEGGIFQEEYLYMTIYSDLDFEATLSIIYGNPIQKSTARALVIEDTKYVPRAQSQKTARTDKIIENLSMDQYKSQNKLKKLLGFQLERSEKQIQAIKLKKQISEDKQIEKATKLIVKDQIVQFRTFEKYLHLRKLKLSELQQEWIQILLIGFLANIIKDKLSNTKRYKQTVARGRLIAWTLKTKTLMRAKEYGNTPKERTVMKCSYITTMFACAVRKKAKVKSQQVVTKFMKQICLFLTIMNKHQSTLKKIIYIQRKFRMVKNKKKNYKTKIWSMIRDNISNVITDLRQKKYNNLFQEQGKKQIQIDIVIMTQLIDQYTNQNKLKWLAYINQTMIEKDLKKKLHDMALNIKEPKMYELPNEIELTQIIEEYANQKKLL